MKWLIKFLIDGANSRVWAFMLACCFKPQLWMALRPMVEIVLALKGNVS